ncbi:fructose-bisphosphate aldolase [Gordonia alkaliphila]|uniref:glycoside hydrolase family 76 protein n=1 Tax=Gordonia alkaliphila TaxID=1053547 RepID=UPI001FF5E8C3|nr:glycoside hydrolase family 76 protein [Gordonia alkaliphila]MCK0438530.1 fructose-bisphosphate aldolase [Gordonia alkaliphila]
MARDVESTEVAPSDDAAAEAAARVRAAVAALRARHLRPIAGVLPGTRIGVASWPRPGRPWSTERLTASWNYWWQAHLVDVLIDAAVLGDPAAPREARAVIRGLRVRNIGRWRNAYYDDMAWLAIALERARRRLPPPVGPDCLRGGLTTLTDVLYDAWDPAHGGGIPWRTTDLFFNVPANGPAGIVLARRDHVARAVATADWIHREFTLPNGLIADGFWVEADGGRRTVDTAFTYCQGVTLGLELECFRRTGGARHFQRLEALVDAVEREMTRDGVLIGHGGGDGGLFSGIAARYLALVATDLPGASRAAAALRSRAGRIVLASADAAWAHRAEVAGLPLFGPDWSTPAVVPDGSGSGASFVAGAVRSSSTPEQDLSVQLAAAMALTAAASVTLRSPEHTGSVTPNGN